jgi:hypothetical protein
MFRRLVIMSVSITTVFIMGTPAFAARHQGIQPSVAAAIGACGQIELTNDPGMTVTSNGLYSQVTIEYGSTTQFCIGQGTFGILFHHRVNGNPTSDVLEDANGKMILDQHVAGRITQEFIFGGENRDDWTIGDDDGFVFTKSATSGDGLQELETPPNGAWTNWMFVCDSGC